MKTFTIDAENNIATHASGKAARETGAAVFATEEQFADLIGPGTKRLIEIWNSLPGVKVVTKFTSRKTATERIWKAIQSLGQTERPPLPLMNRKRLRPKHPFPRPRSPPRLRPLRHTRPTSRRRRLSRRPRPPNTSTFLSRSATPPPHRKQPRRARRARAARRARSSRCSSAKAARRWRKL